MKKEPNYDKVIDLFLAKHEFYWDLLFPYQYKDKVFSSNSHALALIDKSEIKQSDNYEFLTGSKVKVVDNLLQTESNCNLVIDFSKHKLISSEQDNGAMFNGVFIDSIYFNKLKRAVTALGQKTATLIYSGKGNEVLIFECLKCKFYIMPRFPFEFPMNAVYSFIS